MSATNDTRQRLLQAAIALIHQRGFSAVGIQQICQQAQVQKGSFYHFFPSKRALALAAIDELWQQLQQAIFEPAFSAELSPLERIACFFEYSARYQAQQAAVGGQVLGCPLGNLALEMSTQDEVIRQHIASLFQQAEQRIEESLRQAQAEGGFHGDPAITARALFAYMEGVLLIAKTSNDPEQVRLLGRSALALTSQSHAP